MKKLLALVLVIALAATVFACTPSEDEPETSPTPDTSPVVDSPDVDPTDDADIIDDGDVTDGTAEPVPAEIAAAGAMEIGVWPLASGAYDPALDAESIPDGAYIYGFFDAAYANIDLPAAVTGYDAVDSASAVVPGTFAAIVVNGFNYVAIMPNDGAFEPLPVAEPPVADTTGMPAEIAAAGAMSLGTWPLASGAYDPSLDAESIPAGAQLYGFFDAAYANIDFPAAIDGYDAVASTADLTSGTYAPITVNGFNYVVLMP